MSKSPEYFNKKEVTEKIPEITKKEENIKTWAEKLDGEAKLTKFPHMGRNVWLVSGEHFSKKAGEYFEKDIASEIQNPSEWLFLIEAPNSGVYEIEIAKKIAEQKKIPIHNPIFDPYQAEIIELFLSSEKGKKIPKEIVAGQLAANLMLARGTTDLKEIAQALDVGRSEKDLLTCIAVAAFEELRDANAYQDYQVRIRGGLMAISNIVSRQILDYYLKQNPKRKKVAVNIGEGHDSLFKINIEKLPQSLKFSNKQIEDLLAKRKIREIKKVLRMFGEEEELKKEEKEKG